MKTVWVAYVNIKEIPVIGLNSLTGGIEGKGKKMIREEVKVGTYIGGYILAEDVYAFCNMKGNSEADFDSSFYDQETEIVKKIRVVAEDEERVFHWPAFLFISKWYVYRGMIKEAIIFDIALTVCMILCPNNLWILFCYLFWGAISGFKAIPLYYKKIRKVMEKREIIMRTPVESEALSISLRKEGSLSVKRVIIYTISKYLLVQCVVGVIMTINAIG